MNLTVFTPTFNRRDTLHRVYDSLRRQTLDSARYEWIVVDDGSTDETRSLIESWIGGPVSIRYTWQRNAGKHVAWNRAVAMARGELFACVDSDDACVPHALERFVSLWAAAGHMKRQELAGIVVRCQTPDGIPVGPPFPRLEAADYAELCLIYGIRHELWAVCRTDVLRAHPFPEIRVAYLPEGVIWHQIGRRQKWLLHDECLRVYFTADEGRRDQITRMSSWRYAAGLALMHQSMLDNSWRFLPNVPLEFLRTSVHFDRFSLHARLPIDRQIGSLERAPARVLCWTMLPAALTLYALDRVRGRTKTEPRS
jgi:glycosyltransferase involved in cell wall biosynthesis